MKKERTKRRALKVKAKVERRTVALTRKANNLVSTLTNTKKELLDTNKKLQEAETSLAALKDKYEPKAPEAAPAPEASL